MKNRKIEEQQDYLIYNFLPADYCDSFYFSYESDKQITPDDIQVNFWTKQPKLMEKLFELRDFLVKPFGLKGSNGDKQKFEECIRAGTNYRFVSVPAKSESETVLCLDDKHLRAYMSVYIEAKDNNNKIAHLTTIVQFKHWFGYVYFYSISPFHKFGVKKLLKHAINGLL